MIMNHQGALITRKYQGHTRKHLGHVFNAEVARFAATSHRLGIHVRDVVAMESRALSIHLIKERESIGTGHGPSCREPWV